MPFSQLMISYEAALVWMRELGIPPERTRFWAYREQLREISSRVNSKKDSIFTNLREINNLVFEAQDLVLICEGLQLGNDAGLKSRLHDYTKGPPIYLGEDPANSSNRARNIGFELTTLSLIASRGFQLLPEGTADASFSFEGRRFIVECKRPMNLGGVERCIKQAGRQLRQALLGDDSSRGLIALDITRAMNPRFLVYQTNSQSNSSSQALAVCSSFIHRYAEHWRPSRSTRIVGVLVRFRMMSTATSEARIWYTEGRTIKCFDNNSPDDVVRVHKLHSALLSAE